MPPSLFCQLFERSRSVARFPSMSPSGSKKKTKESGVPRNLPSTPMAGQAVMNAPKISLFLVLIKIRVLQYQDRPAPYLQSMSWFQMNLSQLLYRLLMLQPSSCVAKTFSGCRSWMYCGKRFHIWMKSTNSGSTLLFQRQACGIRRNQSSQIFNFYLLVSLRLSCAYLCMDHPNLLSFFKLAKACFYLTWSELSLLNSKFF